MNNPDDNRRFNGGARPGSGKKKLPEGEKKITVSFQVKQKYVELARVKIQKLIDEINTEKD